MWTHRSLTPGHPPIQIGTVQAWGHGAAGGHGLLAPPSRLGSASRNCCLHRRMTEAPAERRRTESRRNRASSQRERTASMSQRRKGHWCPQQIEHCVGFLIMSLFNYERLLVKRPQDSPIWSSYAVCFLLLAESASLCYCVEMRPSHATLVV